MIMEKTVKSNPANSDKCLFCDNNIKANTTNKNHTMKHRGMLPNSDEYSFCDIKFKHNPTCRDHG